MKAILLVAGYATRLYPLTINKPKALLTVNEKPIIDYIFDEIETIDEIDQVYVITNDRFYQDFYDWKQTKKSDKPIKVVNDGTNSDENKLGAIGDIRFLIQEEKIDDDVVIIAGDNLFTYRLKDMYDFYIKVDKDLLCAHELENVNELRRMAIALLDANGKVLDLEEKPQNPKSNIAVYATYMYKRETLPLFDEYIKAGNKPDAPGYFPAWLYNRKDVYAFVFNGECYDIGTPQAYAEVQDIFKDR
jgi:Nucleoside-diphosphate-sugar pyrophosphorylase involved in lipopolysaccharide biosynthesis/translation initiation factor 2B, gamma/epsilon subunits (eIF-2Bgamma/eIF-2Bepsilon)